MAGRRLGFVYGATIVMLVAVLAGFSVNGAQSWIGIGPVEVQPSEFAKPLSIVVLAGYVAEQFCAQHDFPEGARHHVRASIARARATRPRDSDGVRGHLRCCGLRGRSQVVPAWGLFAAGCVAVYLAIKLRILEDYQIARLTSFLDPQSVPAG